MKTVRYYLGTRRRRLLKHWQQWRHSVKMRQQFATDWQTYERLSGTALVAADSLPQLNDRTATTAFNPEYFYQPAWLAGRLQVTRPTLHVDIGSQINMLNVLSAYVPVAFLEIRPLEAQLPQLYSVAGSILELPLASQSVQSLSSLHVVEHIGLGRYGDPINPHGTRQALAEISRVIAPGGHLYLSTPIGRSRVQFNAHRIHEPSQIIEMCAPLRLKAFGVVDGDKWLPVARWEDYQTRPYACGFFEFERL